MYVSCMLTPCMISILLFSALLWAFVLISRYSLILKGELWRYLYALLEGDDSLTIVPAFLPSSPRMAYAYEGHGGLPP